MAESSWPSPSNSRVVDDVQYEKLGITLAPLAGVFGDFTSPQLIYGDASGMQVKCAADRYALVRGHEWYSGASIVTKTIGANASGSTRIDLVVLRLSRTTWDVNLTVIAGTPGAGVPAATQNTGTTGSWDLPLATVTVASGASSISAGNVNYVAPHLTPDSAGYRVPSEGATAYIPTPYPGQFAFSLDGTVMRYDGTSWVQKWGWRDYTPTIYQNITTTRTVLSGTTVNVARYIKNGHMVDVHLDVSVPASTGGLGVSLPFTPSARWLAVGSGGLFTTTSTITQTGVASIGPSGAPINLVHFVRFDNSYTDSVAATTFRCQITYESAS